MKLVGKKLYRVGPLKCFKAGMEKKGPTPEELRMQEWEKESKRDLYDPEQKKLYERTKALAGKVGSGEMAREGAQIGAEAGLKAQLAAAGGGRGSAASRMRGLARAQQAGVVGAGQAAARARQTGAQTEASMLGQAGKGRFGMQKSDKAGRLGYFQKRKGLEVAEKSAERQAAATRDANRCCVHPDTQIAMADGTSKKAKDVRLGDRLKTQAGKGTVEVISNPTLGHRSLYSYGRGSFFITGEHPIHANGEWKSLHIENSKINYGVECKLLQVGDVLTLINGDSVRLEKIEGEANDFDLVLYDFHLDGNEDANHTYYANGLLVHNGGCAGGGEILNKYKRKNGKIEGPGTETSDDIPAMLSDGEFVVNAKTVRGIGESMGAKGEQARQAGSGFLYDLQQKYGDKKPVEKFLGGAQLAELGAHAAKKGLMGKKMKGVGEVAGAALDVKKGIDKKETDRVKEETSGFGKQIKNVDFAKGGDVKLGKGIKAKRKYREAIGWEADKIFDKKAEKDYKEGDTGYKNYKGEKSVTPVEMGLGGFLKKVARVGLKAGAGFLQGGPAGAAVGAGKGVMDEASADKQKSQQKKQAVAESVIAGEEKKKQAAQGLGGEVELKKGGAVKKDHPHKAYLDELDKFMAHAFPKGKKVDLDPAKKAEKAIKSKEGSIDPIKPYEFDKGGSVKSPDIKKALRELKKWKSKSDKKQTEDFRKAKPHLRQRPKDWKKEKWQREQEQLDARKKFRKAEQEMSEADKRKAIRKSRALKDTGGDALDAERIGAGISKIKKDGLGKNIYEKKKGDTRGHADEIGIKEALAYKKKKKGLDKISGGLGPNIFEKKKAKIAPEVSGFGKQLKGVDTSKLSKGLKDKEEKSWWGDMPDKDKAGLVFGAGKGLLSARQQYLKDKQARRQRIAAGERLAGATMAKAGNQLISSGVSLRKGGHVSFKDVLKAKKKMGY